MNAQYQDRSQPRIPEALQAVFLASNRGEDVVKAPPQSVASKTFFKCSVRKTDSAASRDQQLIRPSKRTLQQLVRRFSSGSKKCDASLRSTQLQRCKSHNETPTFTGRKEPDIKPLARKESMPLSQLKSRQSAKIASHSTRRSTTRKKRLPGMSPQEYLDALMRNRGYSIDRIQSLDTAYRQTPTPLQKASYSKHILDIARGNEKPGELRALIEAGLSPNPCNTYSESLLHFICRCKNSQRLQELIECGSELRVCDEYGRIPVHDICWARSHALDHKAFESVDLIMKNVQGGGDHLFNMVDSRGATPLSYIRRDHHTAWIEFLQSKKDEYWPQQKRGMANTITPSTKDLGVPHSRPIKDPTEALPLQLVSMVSSGRITPYEANLFSDESENDGTDSSYWDSSSNVDFCDSPDADEQLSSEATLDEAPLHKEEMKHCTWAPGRSMARTVQSYPILSNIAPLDKPELRGTANVGKSSRILIPWNQAEFVTIEV